MMNILRLHKLVNTIAKKVLSYNVLISFFYLFLAGMIYRKVLASPGVISFQNDWNIPLYSDQIFRWFEEKRYTWTGLINTGSYNLYPADLYFRLILATFAFLGANGDVLTKGICVFLSFLSGFSMHYLSRFLKMKRFPSIISGIFYMLTPFAFSGITSGQIPLTLGYVLLPLALFFFIKSIETGGRFRETVITGFLVVLSAVQLQFAAMLFLLFLLYSIFDCLTSDGKKERFVIYIKVLAIIFSITIAMHGFWFIPLELKRFSDPTTIITWIYPSYPLIDAMRILDHPVHYFTNVIQTNQNLLWIISSLMVVVLAFSTVIIRFKDKKVVFFTLLTTITIFLGKGEQEPAGEVYSWAFSHVPLFTAFRVPYLWAALTCVAYAYLIGIFSEEFYSRLKSFMLKAHLNSHVHNLDRFRIITALLVVCIILPIIFTYSGPILTGNFSGYLHTYKFDDAYQTANKWLEMEQGDFRVLWLPNIPPIGYEGSGGASEDMIAYYSGKPTLVIYGAAYQGEGRLSFPFTSFLTATLYQNKTMYLGKLLGLANVRYVIFRADASSYYPHFIGMGKYPRLYELYDDNSNIARILSQQISISEIRHEGPLTVYNNSFFMSHIFPTDNLALIVGDFSTLVSLSYVENLSWPTMFFASQLSLNELERISPTLNTVIIQNKSFMDLVFSACQGIKIDLDSYEAQLGWSRIHRDMWWYNWDYTAALEGGLLTTTGGYANFSFSNSNVDKYDTWVKLFFGPSGSSVKFFVDNVELGEINTHSTINVGYKWVPLSSIYLDEFKHKIQIVSQGENAIANIIFTRERSVEEAFEFINSLLRDKKVMLINEAESFDSSIASNNFGLNASQGTVLLSNEAREINRSLYIPKDGLYEIYLRAYSEQPQKKLNLALLMKIISCY